MYYFYLSNTATLNSLKSMYFKSRLILKKLFKSYLQKTKSKILAVLKSTTINLKHSSIIFTLDTAQLL